LPFFWKRICSWLPFPSKLRQNNKNPKSSGFYFFLMRVCAQNRKWQVLGITGFGSNHLEGGEWIDVYVGVCWVRYLFLGDVCCAGMCKWCVSCLCVTLCQCVCLSFDVCVSCRVVCGDIFFVCVRVCVCVCVCAYKKWLLSDQIYCTIWFYLFYFYILFCFYFDVFYFVLHCIHCLLV